MWRAAVLCLLLASQDPPSSQLRDGGWRAVDSLVSRGKEVRPALEELARSTDDAGFLARAALAELEALEGPDARALVRTQGIQDTPAADAAAALFRAAGLSFVPSNLPDRPVTLPDGLPLLEALELLSRKLDVEFYPGDKGVWRVARGYLDAPRFAFRHFRARMDFVHVESRTDFERFPVTSCRFRIRFDNDQGARLLSISNVRILEAADDRDADLRRKPSPAPTVENLPEGHTITLDLRGPSKGARCIPKLRLALEATLERGRETVRFKVDRPDPEGTPGVAAKLKRFAA
ncbi:MAG TPA: hypothetical protein VI643_08190, partial [Planctomycetota bacterium]|nr:hypothetical protein [Planctomycetota bacterium]